MEVTERGLLLAKAEVTYGTDPTPVVATNTIAAVRNQVTYEVDSQRVQRQILDGTHRRVPGFVTLETARMRFRTEVRGNRTDGVADDISKGAIAQAIEIHPLLAAANLQATYTAESTGGARDGNVTYKPYEPVDDGPSVTLYFYTHEKLHKITGGKVEEIVITFEAGQMAYIDFTVRGKYVAIADATFPTSITWLNTKPPVVEGLTATYGGYAANWSQATLSIRNQLAMRKSGTAADGVAGFLITGREITGSIDPEAVEEATNPFWAQWKADDVDTLSLVLGTQTGNTFTLTATAQAVNLNYGDREGGRIHNLQYEVVAAGLSTTPGDELQLKFS